MVIPPFYLTCYRDRTSGMINAVELDTKELVLEDETIVDAILMKNQGLRTPAQLSVATDTDSEFEFPLDGSEVELTELGRYLAGGGTVELIEHCHDHTERRHRVQVAEVFESQMEWFKQKASA